MIESRTCLLPMITPQSRYMLRMFEHYKNRLLPYAGGILEQPNFYGEAMEILSQRDRLITAQRDEREAQNHGRQSLGDMAGNLG